MATDRKLPVQAFSLFKRCAQCGEPIALPATPGDDATGATLWSDGYLEMPDQLEAPILGKCRACGAIGFLAELPLLYDLTELRATALHRGRSTGPDSI